MRIHVTFASLWMTLCSCQPVQFSLYAHFSGRWVTWPEGFTMVALWMGSDKWGLFERTSNLGWNLVKWSCLSPLFSLSFTSNSDGLSCSWTWKQLQYCGKAFFPSWFLGGFWLGFFGHIHHIYMFQIINISFYILVSFQPLHSFSGRCITWPRRKPLLAKNNTKARLTFCQKTSWNLSVN